MRILAFFMLAGASFASVLIVDAQSEPRQSAIAIQIKATYACNCFSPDVRPAYKVDIDGTGAIVFEGSDLTAIAGRHRAKVTPLQVQQAYESIARSSAPPGWPKMGSSIRGIVTVRRGGEQIFSKEFSYDGAIDRGTRLTASRHPTFDAVNSTIDLDRWIRGNDATPSALAAEGWNFKAPSIENQKLIEGVARHGTIHGLLALIELGAPVSQAQLSARPPIEETPYVLGAVAERGDDAAIELLLSSNQRWNRAELNGALLGLARFGKTAAVSRLIDAGADPLFENAYGVTPLMAAASSNSPELVAFMTRLDYRIRKRDPSGLTALHHAVVGAAAEKARSDNVDGPRVVELLLRAGAKVDATDSDGTTPLMLVGPRADVARSLIASGANPNARDRYGRSPLTETLHHVDVVALLLKHGANPNKYRTDRWPLLQARDSSEITRLLIRAGANPNARDENGHTVLMYCPSLQVASELLRAGADPTHRNARGQDVVEILQGNGCQNDVVVLVANATQKTKHR